MAGLGFEETELRLGLPGDAAAGDAAAAARKRGFEETIDLKLKLEQPASTAAPPHVANEAEDGEVEEAAAADVAAAAGGGGNMKRSPSQSSVVTAAAAHQPDLDKPRAPKYVASPSSITPLALLLCSCRDRELRDDPLPLLKNRDGESLAAQAVGWPPVRSFRKNILQTKGGGDKDDGGGKSGGGAAALVKVSMDGAPYLRKVDLRMYGSYQELSKPLEKMFSSFTIGRWRNARTTVEQQGIASVRY
ncbi:hypothetical protein HU200_022816 [Digitaria exilis]|uniref:Auxin-responsive protein n=1 Tax=Digitaria exilis TaxID=1010633 RepID=A0A835C6V3_9POAL|nr:hypothetical protein HU200_022816 [Digitaria exilis]